MIIIRMSNHRKDNTFYFNYKTSLNIFSNNIIKNIIFYITTADITCNKY